MCWGGYGVLEDDWRAQNDMKRAGESIKGIAKAPAALQGPQNYTCSDSPYAPPHKFKRGGENWLEVKKGQTADFC